MKNRQRVQRKADALGFSVGLLADRLSGLAASYLSVGGPSYSPPFIANKYSADNVSYVALLTAAGPGGRRIGRPGR